MLVRIPRLFVFALLGYLAVATPGHAQKSAAQAALEAARAALVQGSPEAALGHLSRAAAQPSLRADAALELARVAVELKDPDLCATAALLFAEATATDKGAGAPAKRGAFDYPGVDVSFEKLARESVDARLDLVRDLMSKARELESSGARSPESLLVSAWARRFGLDLVQRMPRAAASMVPHLKPSVSTPKGAHGPVLKALDRVGARALATNDVGTAVRAGRLLKGLGVQADFGALRGPRPGGMAKWRARGADLLGTARERLADRLAKPWTLEELEWLATEEGEAFTRAHDSFAEPGVAISPRGWYRIESDCGHETLLAVASMIEQHHGRLANYFGADPFVRGVGTEGEKVERQGLIRIVPDPSGLEAEGAPHFWAGGFQSGDTTVVRHSVATTAQLGRTLTHELTHRFDGALHQGIPAWLVEGRAVWTAAAYRGASDEEFVDDFCSPLTMRTVLNTGLSGGERLRLLLSGTPTDYRQNYSCGAALYVFLTTWFPGDASSMSEGSPVFRDQLLEFENRGKHKTGADDRLESFLDTFCDGNDGRPSSLDEFQGLFRTFLEGFDPREPAAFTKRYTTSFPDADTGVWIYDEPTWTWDWLRAEPTFGENQARLAGEFLAEFEKDKEALRAFVWARSVDGYDPRTASGIAQILEAEKSPNPGKKAALWATQHERLGEPFATRIDQAAARARLGPFPGGVEAVQKALQALREVSADLESAGAPRSSARVAGDAQRLGAWAGVSVPGQAPPAQEAAGARFAEPVELTGWVEEELTRIDDDRKPGLYSVEPDGELLLGRKEARTGTGRFDRGGGGKSFIRAGRWMLPGAYRLSTKVRFTTGFNTAIVVVGWTSRGRNIRLHVTAGDFDYAVGESDEEPTFEKVSWRFNGMRTRDEGLPGSVRGGSVELERSSTAVDVVLVVSGPVVSAFIAGTFVGSYHTIDGAPIEGCVGVGTIRGAVALSPPLVERLDREPVAVLDLVSGTGPVFSRLRNCATFFGPGYVPASNGALVFWVPAATDGGPVRTDAPAGEDEGARALHRARRAAIQLLQRMSRNGFVQPLVVALPKSFEGEESLEKFRTELQKARPEGAPEPRIVFHGVVAPEGAVAIDDDRRWLLFVDGFGVARAVRPWIGANAADNDVLEHWLTVFRDYGRPERSLPTLERQPAEDD